MRVKIYRAFLLLFISTSLIVWYLASTNIPHNRIVFFNVGQGDSALIESEDGFQILIDTGSDAQAVGQLGAVLPPWDRTIDIMILTHLHADHIGGVKSIAQKYDIGTILVNSQEYNSPIISELQDVFLLDSVGDVEGFFSGESFVTPMGVIVRSVWPQTTYNQKTNNINNTSIVVVVDMFGMRALFTGDLELGREEFSYLPRVVGDIDILKVPHHGSELSLSRAILHQLQPEVAVISVGDNSYGHPSDRTLDLVRERGIVTYRTDLNGMIEVNVDRENLNYRTIDKYD